MHQLFQRVPIFAGLSLETLDVLSKKAQETSVPAGALVVKEGESGNRFFLIGDGSVRVVKAFGTPDACELAVLGKANFFGEMCILETLPRAATVEAIEPTTLYSLSSMSFYHLYETVPKEYSILILNIARDLSRRLRHLDEEFAGRH